MVSVCDQAPSNVKAVNSLINSNCYKSKTNKPAAGLFQYKIRDTDIIHCWDPPHLIKGIRNNLITKELQHHVTKRWNVTCTDFHENIRNQPARRASWNHVKKFYHWANGGSTKLLEKITHEHIEPDKDKVKVSNATQVFRKTFGDLMLKYELLHNSSDTEEILLFFNDVFDSVNGSSNAFGNALKTAVSEKSIHFAFWEYALCMLSKMHFIETVENKKSRKDPRKVVVTERESKRTRVIQNWQSTILGCMELSRRCFNLKMTNISLRYTKNDFIFLVISRKSTLLVPKNAFMNSVA